MLEIYLKRKRELEQKIKSNEDWLVKNWTLGKQVRRDCNYNIYKDKEELKLIEQSIKDISGRGSAG